MHRAYYRGSIEMKIQDNDTKNVQNMQAPPSPTARGKGRRWIAGIGAIIVVALLVGASAVVFAQLARNRSGPGTSRPASGKWEAVLKGYTITSLAEARSNPSILYACATQSPNSGTGSVPFTVLRSTNLGTHWQDVGSKAGIVGSCELAVNPDNSNDIYVVSGTSNTGQQTSSVLKHSTDGGQSWDTVTPTLQLPGNSGVRWYVQHLTIEGNRLFGVQWVPLRALPLGPPTIPQVNVVSHLVTSVDGGHNWAIIGNQAHNTYSVVRDYAVDPSNPDTIYEIIGTPWYPYPPVPRAQPGEVIPPAFNGMLYKTTDNGVTWQLLLKNLPLSAKVQLATNKPQIIYAGGLIGPIPYAATPPESSTYPYPTYPYIRIGYFQLQMSSDGGAHWRTITPPASQVGILDWFVSSDGQVYVGRFSITATGQPTAVKGTVGPPIRVTLPPSAAPPTTQGGSPPVIGGAPAQSNSGSSAVVPASTPTTAPAPAIQRFNPNTNSWSTVTNPPASGTLLTVTPVDAGGGAVLWFMGTVNGEEVLYRYVV